MKQNYEAKVRQLESVAERKLPNVFNLCFLSKRYNIKLIERTQTLIDI